MTWEAVKRKLDSSIANPLRLLTRDELEFYARSLDAQRWRLLDLLGECRGPLEALWDCTCHDVRCDRCELLRRIDEAVKT